MAPQTVCRNFLANLADVLTTALARVLSAYNIINRVPPKFPLNLRRLSPDSPTTAAQVVESAIYRAPQELNWSFLLLSPDFPTTTPGC